MRFLFQQTLTGSTNVEQIVDFILELPEDIADGTYDFNIVGIDQNGGENKVSVRVRVGGLGILSIIIDKLLGKTTVDLSVISNNLKDLSIPNIVIIVLILIIFSVIPLLLLGTYKFRIYIIILSPILFIILTFVFILE